MAIKNEALLIATRNPHKTGEFRTLFGQHYDVCDLTQYPELPEVEETGETFEENSALKAVTISRHQPAALVLADDSGLEVDALDGAPGVYSARYSGPEATDATNRDQLLHALADAAVRGKARTARFRCVLTLARNGKTLHQTSGAVEGIIANQEKGDHGFGYDPIFIPEGHCQTFGELPGEVKHTMSHRGRALSAMIDHMKTDGLML